MTTIATAISGSAAMGLAAALALPQAPAAVGAAMVVGASVCGWVARRFDQAETAQDTRTRDVGAAPYRTSAQVTTEEDPRVVVHTLETQRNAARRRREFACLAFASSAFVTAIVGAGLAAMVGTGLVQRVGMLALPALPAGYVGFIAGRSVRRARTR